MSGAHLSHRLSGDVDLFCHRAEDVRVLVRELPDVARECGLGVELVRDAGTFVRARVRLEEPRPPHGVPHLRRGRPSSLAPT